MKNQEIQKPSRKSVIWLKGLSLGVAFIVLALFVVPFFLPQSWYLNKVIGYVEKRYPVRLKVNEASLFFLPRPGITLRQINIQIVYQKQELPFIEAQQFKVLTDWSSLFRKHVNLDIEADEPKVWIQQIEEGQYHFLKLFAGLETTAPAPSNILISEAYAQESNAQSRSTNNLVLTSVHLNHFSLSYQPLQGEKKTFNDWNLHIEDVVLNPEEYTAFFDIEGPVPQVASSPRVHLKGKGVYLKQEGKAWFDDAKLTMGKLAAQVSGKMYPEENKPVFEIVALVSSFKAADLNPFVVQQKEMLSKVGGLYSLNTNMKYKSAGWNGKLKLNSNNASYQDPSGLNFKGEKLSLVTLFSKKEKGIGLSKGRLELGPQALAFSGLAGDGVSLSIETKKIDFAHLQKIYPALKELPPTKGLYLKGDLKAASNKTTFKAHMRAKEVKYPDYPLQNVKTNLVYQGQKAELSQLEANVLEGKLTGKGAAQLKKNQIKYNIDASILNANLKKVKRLHGLVAGRGLLKLKGSGANIGDAHWFDLFNGDGLFDFTSVKIPTLNIFKRIFDNPLWKILTPFPNVINRAKLNSLKSLDQKMRDLAGAFIIKNGFIELHKINLKFPSSMLQLKGGIGLDKKLNFKGNLILEKNLVDQLIRNQKLKAVLMKNNKLSIPLTIKGKASAPIVSPDLGFLKQKIKSFAKNQARNRIKDKVKEKIQKKLPHSAKKKKDKAKEVYEGIKGLF